MAFIAHPFTRPPSPGKEKKGIKWFFPLCLSFGMAGLLSCVLVTGHHYTVHHYVVGHSLRGGWYDLTSYGYLPSFKLQEGDNHFSVQLWEENYLPMFPGAKREVEASGVNPKAVTLLQVVAQAKNCKTELDLRDIRLVLEDREYEPTLFFHITLKTDWVDRRYRGKRIGVAERLKESRLVIAPSYYLSPGVTDGWYTLVFNVDLKHRPFSVKLGKISQCGNAVTPPPVSLQWTPIKMRLPSENDLIVVP